MASTSFIIDMRAPLDKLRGDMAAASSVVARSARSMGQGFGSFTSSLGGSIASLLTFRTIIGTVLGTAGLGLLIKNAIQSGDAIGEMATRVGLTTTALQEYTHAVSQGGASAEQFETSVRILNQRLAEAAGGDKKFSELFKSLNVATTVGGNIRDLDSVLGDLADRFKAMESPVQRAALAQELFGRSGSRMLPTLIQGRAGIQALRDEAHRMGTVLSTDAIQASDRAADSLVRLGNVISANLTRVIADLGPTIEDMSNKIVEMIGKLQPFLQLLASNEAASLETLSKRLALVTEEIKRLESAASGTGFRGWLDRLAQGAIVGTAKAKKSLADLRNEQEQLALLFSGKQLQAPAAPQVGAAIPKSFGEAQRNALEEARRLLQSLAPDITAVDKKVLDLANRFDQLAEKAGPASAQVLALKTEALELARAAGELDIWEKVRDSFEKSLPTFDAEAKAVAEIRKQAAEAAKEAPRYAQAIQDQAEALIAATAEHTKTKAAIASTSAAYEQAEEAARAYGAFVRELRKPFEELDDAIAEHIVNLAELRTATDVLAASGIAGTFGQAQQQELERHIQDLARRHAALNAQLGAEDLGIDRVRELKAGIETVNTELAKTGLALRDVVEQNRVDLLAADFAIIDKQARLFGEGLEGLTAKIIRNRQEILTLFTAGAAVDDARVRALQKQNDILTRQATIVQFVSDSVQIGMTRATDTIVDAFLAGEIAAVKWGDVVQDVLADIIKQMIQIFVIEVALKALRGVATSAFGGGGEISGTATGGVVFGPQVRLVGEAGPEAIIPLDKFDFGGGGGGDVIVNIHPPADTESRTQESTDRQGKRTIDVFITNVVRKGLAQGAFDREMAGVFGASRQGTRR